MRPLDLGAGRDQDRARRVGPSAFDRSKAGLFQLGDVPLGTGKEQVIIEKPAFGPQQLMDRAIAGEDLRLLSRDP